MLLTSGHATHSAVHGDDFCPDELRPLLISTEDARPIRLLRMCQHQRVHRLSMASMNSQVLSCCLRGWRSSQKATDGGGCIASACHIIPPIYAARPHRLQLKSRALRVLHFCGARFFVALQAGGHGRPYAASGEVTAAFGDGQTNMITHDSSCSSSCGDTQSTSVGLTPRPVISSCRASCLLA